MPFSLSYSLTTPTPAEEALAGLGVAQFALSGAQLVCDAEAQTQQDFLDLIDRVLPDEYIQPLKLNPNSGYEIFQMIAAVGERLSLAVKRAECGLVISYSDLGSYAETEVVFYRETDDAGAFTMLTGTLVRTSSPVRYFETIEDAIFGALDLEVTVKARAVERGYEYNVPGERVTAALEQLPGSIDTIEVPLQSPPYSDTSVRVRQLIDATGGSAPTLQQHGSDRGLTQAEGESVDAFRERIKTLPDVITPAAIRRILSRLLDPLGMRWELIETWRIDYVPCFDAPSANVGTPTWQESLPPAPFDTHTFFYDDPRPAWPFRGRMLDVDSYRGAFYVIVDLNTGGSADCAFVWDDPAPTLSSLSVNVARGTPAWDSPTAEAIPVGCFDGFDFGKASSITTLNISLQAAKAAGISYAIDYPHDW